MKIRNPQAEALESTLTPADFGKAMAQLDLSVVPPHKRFAAIRDHMATIMRHTLVDREKAQEVAAAQVLHRAGAARLLQANR